VKLKLDENIPSSAKSRLIALGFDTDTVLDEELGGQSDIHVWTAAQGHERGRRGSAAHVHTKPRDAWRVVVALGPIVER
jgi:hypothetical protein